MNLIFKCSEPVDRVPLHKTSYGIPGWYSCNKDNLNQSLIILNETMTAWPIEDALSAMLYLICCICYDVSAMLYLLCFICFALSVKFLSHLFYVLFETFETIELTYVRTYQRTSLFLELLSQLKMVQLRTRGIWIHIFTIEERCIWFTPRAEWNMEEGKTHIPLY